MLLKSLQAKKAADGCASLCHTTLCQLHNGPLLLRLCHAIERVRFPSQAVDQEVNQARSLVLSLSMHLITLKIFSISRIQSSASLGFVLPLKVGKLQSRKRLSNHLSSTSGKGGAGGRRYIVVDYYRGWLRCGWHPSHHCCHVVGGDWLVMSWISRWILHGRKLMISTI